MATLYIKEKATNRLMLTVDGHTENSPEAKVTIDNYLEGRTADEFETGVTDDNTVNGWIAQQAEDEKTYADKRREEYNKLNQMEMRFNDERDGTTTWVDAINEIKARFPKPS
tara:strand:- start:458 stop:793 length:336 start_codon:yes stop_codon:yes gene_type:complete